MSDERLTRNQQYEAAAIYEALPLMADALPVHDSKDGGRPRKHSVFSLLLAHVIVTNLFESRVREAIKELNDPQVWANLESIVRTTYPNRPDFWLSAEPPTRSAFIYFRDTYITSEAGQTVVQTILEETGRQLAAELDLCQESTAGSWTNPSTDRTVQIDGTVGRAVSNQPDGEPIVDK